ncbi:MAG: GNAT family N-acetyltransferase [Betaproteobacteria bacterium HGW-Betaproteobacteria-8]|nr:MAG: GNAT family N-acetyltransferase [Betaproteobacteria bacterium HGW-Betaproteobacteria-8]
MSLNFEIAGSVSEVDPASWDALTDGTPLLSHAFLSALEKTGCVGAGTGWQPYPLLLTEGDRLLGAMPLYAKSHSYGEYVFDWAWANAFEQHGIAYYPKLISAIPFTPVTGARLLSQDPGVRRIMVEVLSEQLQKLNLSSAHVLFPDDDSAEPLEQSGWLRRNGMQFRWENENFENFEAFLATLTHDKRKKIRQERKRVAASGIVSRRLTAGNISKEDWELFYQCYVNTYHQHRSSPYLTKAFFHELALAMPQNILLVVAERAGESIAAALNIYGQNRDGVSYLYGRYWGALQYVPGLHFELCYYQAQEFCIERGIRYFEGGAQGEHKLARGFRPRPTCSFHKIAHPDFAGTIARVLQREAKTMEIYQNELEEREPFKR